VAVIPYLTDMMIVMVKNDNIPCLESTGRAPPLERGQWGDDIPTANCHLLISEVVGSIAAILRGDRGSVLLDATVVSFQDLNPVNDET
jgi:hypothetical protein